MHIRAVVFFNFGVILLHPRVAVEPDFANGQDEQLELNLGNLPLNILIGKAQVDACSIDVLVPQLLLKSI